MYRAGDSVDQSTGFCTSTSCAKIEVPFAPIDCSDEVLPTSAPPGSTIRVVRATVAALPMRLSTRVCTRTFADAALTSAVLTLVPHCATCTGSRTRSHTCR